MEGKLELNKLKSDRQCIKDVFQLSRYDLISDKTLSQIPTNTLISKIFPLHVIRIVSFFIELVLSCTIINNFAYQLLGKRIFQINSRLSIV